MHAKLFSHLQCDYALEERRQPPTNYYVQENFTAEPEKKFLATKKRRGLQYTYVLKERDGATAD